MNLVGGKRGRATINDASTEILPKRFNLRGSQKQGGCQLAAEDGKRSDL